MFTNSSSQSIKSVLQKIGRYSLILAAIVIASTVTYYIGILQSQKPEKPTIQIQPAIRLKNVSIAVNERNEMLIIDRKTGEYLTYQDSVGMAIFSMYANRFYSNNK